MAGENVEDNLRISHLLHRAGFGEAPARLRDLQKRSYQNIVNQLFAAGADLTVSLSGTKEQRGQDFAKLRAAWIQRMVQTNAPFLEKMTLFWHNHFATAEYKVNDPALMLRQNNTLRKNALGSFRQMLLDVTADPAMLIWLDGASSTKKSPNENYGRELMELFTIGLHYTQDDVTAAAKSMTGYRLNRTTGIATWVPERHDTTQKTLFGRTGNFGPSDVIDILLSQPDCAPFVVTKILKWFVHPEPPQSWIDKFSGVFVQSNFHIGTLMKSIFLSSEFSSDAAVGVLYKTPIDYAVGLARMSGVAVSATELDRVASDGGMTLFNPPNVAGWTGGSSWVNSATLLSRFNFAYALSERMPQGPVIADQAGADFGVNLSPSTRQRITDYLSNHTGNDLLRYREMLYLLWTSPECQMC